MKMNKAIQSIVTVAGLSIATSIAVTGAHAEETLGEKAKHGVNKAGDSVKEAARNGSDKTCETVHGKLKCFPGKAKHKSKTAVEKGATEVEHMKDKAD